MVSLDLAEVRGSWEVGQEVRRELIDIMMVPGLPSRSGQTPGKWLTTVCRLVPLRQGKVPGSQESMS